LLIVVCAPAITVATGVFVATMAAHGGSAVPATLLPLLMPRCRQTAATAAELVAAATALLPPPKLCCCQAATYVLIVDVVAIAVAIAVATATFS
jgi:hypothetical protein